MAGVEVCAARTKVHGIPGTQASPWCCIFSVCNWLSRPQDDYFCSRRCQKEDGRMAMANKCGWLSLFRRFFSKDIYGSFYLRFFGYKGFWGALFSTRVTLEKSSSLWLLVTQLRLSVSSACSSSFLSFTALVRSHSAGNELELEMAKWQAGQGHRARGARSRVCCLTVLSSSLPLSLHQGHLK